MLIKIPNCSFIVLSGDGAKTFLQSMATTNVNKLSEKDGIWGAILTPQGKFQFGFFAFQHQNKIYIETTPENLMPFGKFLSKYALNVNTEFSIDNNINVYANINENIGDELEFDINTKYENKIIIDDPRTNKMGKRIYCLNGETINTNGDFLNYEEHRINNHAPDLNKDAHINKCYALELNMDKFNGVSFEKGCYIGQEVTARMHYRNKVKRKLAVVQCDNVCAENEIIVTQNGKVAGGITSVAGKIAMASIREQYLLENEVYFTQDGTTVSIKR